MQRPLFEPVSDWKPPSLDELPSFRDFKRICLDVETYDPNLKKTGPSVRTGGHLAGVGVGFEDGPRHYLPFAHEGGDNLPREAVLGYLEHELKNYTGEIVGANLSYDLDWLWAAGIEMPCVSMFRDVLIAEPLIDDNKFRYSLNSVAEDWLGEMKDDDGMLRAAREYGLKKDSELGAWIHVLPARHVGPYGEQDVNLPLKLLRLQEKEIESQGIGAVWDLESRVLPVLVKMRQRGVRVDQERLEEVGIMALKGRREAAELMTKLSGVSVGPEDAQKKSVLLPALRAAGHQLDASDSLDKTFIAARQQDCEVVAALGQLRKWSTLQSLCIDPVREHLVNGRIHCSFNQLAKDKDDGKGSKGARYGRLSCEHVNMQQQPSRGGEDEASQMIAAVWRKIYLPEEGALWGSNDYSQQEPRMLVHFAEKVAKIGHPEYPMRCAQQAAQSYRDDPDMDNHDMMTRMVYGEDRVAAMDKKEYKRSRSNCKIIFLGMCYGMGERKLCADLQLPTEVITLKRGPRRGQRMVVAGEEGKRLFDTFHTRVPFVREMSNLCNEQAVKKGYIETILGRRCRFPKDDDGLNYKWTNKALNRLIQGSSADQTKAALVAADAAGHFLQLQVHDEITGSFATEQEARDMARVMLDCVEMNVPSKVDVEIGPSWGEAK